MHNLDDMIEKYRHELMEFSQQSPAIADEKEYRDFVPTVAEPDTQVDEFDKKAGDMIIIEPYKNNEDFESRNGSSGVLRVQVFAADQGYPVSGADVTVKARFLTGDREFFRGRTDIDGIVDNITLPTPSRMLSLDEDNTAEPFSLYNIRVSHPDYAVGEFSNVPVFDSVKSIQPVELVPLTQSGNEPREIDFGSEV